MSERFREEMMRRILGVLLVVVLALMPFANSTLAAATPEATSMASPVAALDEDITFESGADTLYGSLRIPDGVDAPAPAVLIISGSGPTDRDGNSPGLLLGTNAHLADDLAELGVISFRYDKLGSGETGLGSHADGSGGDYELFLQEAWDAFDVLAQRPEVDPDRITVLGHSEGALFALDMATDTERDVRPAGLILAAPLSIRYLDLLREQIGDAYADLVAAGQLTDDQEKTLTGELDAAIDEIRETGELTVTFSDPSVRQLFSSGNMQFLYQADQRDPAVLAGEVPADMPVMILHGAKDEQVTTAQVDVLEQGFIDSGHEQVTRVEIEDANHIFQVIAGEPNAAVDYVNPDLEFSAEVAGALAAFFASA